MIGLVHKTNSSEQPRMQHTAMFHFLVIVITMQGQEPSQSFQVFWNAFFSLFVKKKPSGKLV
jgi:hypothetical protein